MTILLYRCINLSPDLSSICMFLLPMKLLLLHVNSFASSSFFAVFTLSVVAFPSSGVEVAVPTAITHCGAHTPSAFLPQPNNVLRNPLFFLFSFQPFGPSLPIRRLLRNLFLGFGLACAPWKTLDASSRPAYIVIPSTSQL
jgi:hypothetical protein